MKFSKGSVNGGADFLNISKIKNSDLTFMVSCKVTNQTTTDSGLTRFSPVAGLKAGEFPRVYGDSFISGKRRRTVMQIWIANLLTFRVPRGW